MAIVWKLLWKLFFLLFPVSKQHCITARGSFWTEAWITCNHRLTVPYGSGWICAVTPLGSIVETISTVWVCLSPCFLAFVFASPPQVMAGVGGYECSDASVFISISTLVLFHHGASSHLPPNITSVFPEELRHRTTEPCFDHHKDPRVSQGDRSLFLSFFKSLVFPRETLVSKDKKGRGGELWGRSGFSQVTNQTVLLVSSSQFR